MNDNQNYLSGFDSVEQTTPKKTEGTFKPTPMFSGMKPQTPPTPNPVVKPTASAPVEKVAPAVAPNEPAQSVFVPSEGKKVEVAPEIKTAPAVSNPVVTEAAIPAVEPEAPKTAPVEVKPEMPKVAPVEAKPEMPKVAPVEAKPVAPKTEPPVFMPSGTYSYSANKAPENVTVPNPVSAQTPTPSTPVTPPISAQPPVDTENPSPKKPKKEKKAKKEKKPKKYGAGIIVISALLAALLGAGGGIFGVFYAQKYFTDTSKTSSSASDDGDKNDTPQNVTNITVDETVNSTVEAVAKKAGPSIVGIRTTAAVTNFFGGSSEATGEGSGIIYSTDGYIITNYHVIESAVESSNSKVEVFLSDDTETAIEATVVGYNIASDLAVVKVEKTGLTAVEFTDSDKLKVGQYVVAIGNPGGLEFIGSVSYGVISGLNRSVAVGTGSAMSLIQTDAAINPGNSGGALVDINGKLIGVNSIKLVSTGYEGMGFAIPSNTVKEICDNIIDKQNEPTPYIGIEISQSYTAEQLIAFGYPAGAVVVSVAPGGPADESQIQRGDIITEFNGKAINDYTELENAILQCKPGDSVTVKIFRAGRFYSSHINVAANNS